MNDLKHCPFCGVMPILLRYPFSDIIRCENQRCPVQPSIGVSHEYCRYDNEIIDKWNMRNGEQDDKA